MKTLLNFYPVLKLRNVIFELYRNKFDSLTPSVLYRIILLSLIRYEKIKIKTFSHITLSGSV